jgi:hypothetical protein
VRAVASKHERDITLAAELGALALDGDLDAACLLGVIEAPYTLITNLAANPQAAGVYDAARAVELLRLEAEYDELADMVAAALL